MNTIYLCLSDLLDQNLTAFEYFQTLSPSLQHTLHNREIHTFDELQDCAQRIKKNQIFDEYGGL